MQGVDMAGGILGISAIGAETVMAMSLFIVAVIQAGSVQPAQTILTAATAFMRLDCHAVAFFKFGHLRRNGDHNSCEFMAWNELSQFGIAFPAFCDDGGIATADGNRMDFDQRLAGAQGRHGYFGNPQITEIEQHCGFHGFGEAHKFSFSILLTERRSALCDVVEVRLFQCASTSTSAWALCPLSAKFMVPSQPLLPHRCGRDQTRVPIPPAAKHA